MLLDSQATRNNIYNKLRSYAEKVGPKDNFMVYFSGHGFFDDVLNEGYWIPVDADKTVGDYLSNSDVLKIIKNINSQHTLIVSDACFAGSLFNETSRGLKLGDEDEVDANRKFISNIEKFRSRWGLASGRLEEVSDGVVGKNSPFAQNLLHFFRTNQFDKVAISEIVQYVKEKVPAGSQQTPIGNPLKNAGDEGGEFIFYKRK
ncbi:MAG: caspase family protein [Chitinophagaceae bacterium]